MGDVYPQGSPRGLLAAYSLHSADRDMGFARGCRDPGPTAVVRLLVTFGQRQGKHEYDESITADGVLTWQSQPRQRLRDSTIKQLIDHDDQVRTIHLFLRMLRNAPYVYCGTLGYLSHDEEREQPVHFQWQLMDWPPPGAVLPSIGVDPTTTASPASSSVASTLIVEPRPQVAPRGARSTAAFAATRQATHPDQDARNATLGLTGERLVLAGGTLPTHRCRSCGPRKGYRARCVG
jgi:hypothetical protein